jgi:hypothetical protein
MGDSVLLSGAAAFLTTTSLTAKFIRSWHSRRQNEPVRRRAVALLTPGIAASLFCFASPVVALAQDAAGKDGTPLPPVVIDSPKIKPKRVAAKRPAPTRAVSSRGGDRAGQVAQDAPVAGADAPTPAQAALDQKMQGFDQSRDHVLTKLGATSYTIDRTAIETMPQGDNTPVDKLVLQLPGVNYDSAASNPNFHVRGEYANVQTRINGLVLPEGVSGLGPVIDTNFIGSLSLLTGTLPAQYGLRTAGVLDITSRAFSISGGSVSVYGGSNSTITPSFDYGGGVDNTQYFFSGRGNWNNLGIENPTSSINAIHDHTDQGKFFAYVSTAINDTQRVSVISGASYSAFQIPNNPNQPVFPDSNGILPNGLGMTTLSNLANTANSSNFNEREIDQYYYNIVALQSHGELIDSQISVFSRYANVHFIPDVTNDLIFNGVASDVTRASQMYGTQFDASYDVNSAHTLRFGFMVTAEKTDVSNISTVFNVDPATGNPTGAPFTVTDSNSLLGWNLGAYVQDEWKLTSQLTLNYGIRFDQLYQFVNAPRWSISRLMAPLSTSATPVISPRPCRRRRRNPILHLSPVRRTSPTRPITIRCFQSVHIISTSAWIRSWVRTSLLGSMVTTRSLPT